MNYFKQIWYEMRHQKMMTWVSISGTALSIFLVMALFMNENVTTVAISPESNRPRIFIGENMHAMRSENREQSSPVSYEYAKRLYGGLEGIEMESYISAWPDNCDVSIKGGNTSGAFQQMVDDAYWKIYDFTFIDGKPFDKAESDAGAKIAIISRSMARKLFGEDKVAGREILIDYVPYRVKGVVEDGNPLLSDTYAHIYTIYDKGETARYDESPMFGNARVILLAREGVKADDLRKQVKSRYAILAKEAKTYGDELIYHEQPYTIEESLTPHGSNNTPDVETSRNLNLVMYAILLLLPAINLSSMTRSRLRHRVSEIGVRRAFGAKKRSIISQILGENFIITIAGGVIGLILSILFVVLVSDLFFTVDLLMTTNLDILYAKPSLGMLLTWKNFAIALGLCFILNIISATVPAWKAARVEPAQAISKSR